MKLKLLFPYASSNANKPSVANTDSAASASTDAAQPTDAAADAKNVDPKKQKSLQESIKILLKEPISRAAISSQHRAADLNHSSRRRKKLASFMGTLLEEMTRAETPKADTVTTGNPSVLGNISPHHDETGSESPPSYNQLNYNDNLTRFFNSQPKTLTEKEASAIEPNCIMSNEDFKTAVSFSSLF